MLRTLNPLSPDEAQEKELPRIPHFPDRPLPFIRYVFSHSTGVLKVRAAIALLFECSATAADVMVTWVLGRIVGVIINAGTNFWPAVTHELWILAGLWTWRNLSFRVREYMERHYVPALLNIARGLLFNRLIHQSQAFLHSNFAGVLANHVRRAGDVVSSLRDKFQYNIIPLGVRFITVGILLGQITPLFDLFLFGFLAVGIFAAVKTAPIWTRLSADQAESSSRLTGYIVDSATNLSLVQQNGGWREERRRLSLAHDNLTRAYRTRYAFVSRFWGTFDLATTFFFCGFMAILAYSWQSGHVSAAQLAMAVGLVTNMFGALAGTVSLLSSKFDDIGILQEALQKIATPFSVTEAPDAQPMAVTGGNIEFRDVTFSYSGHRNLFEGFSLTIPAGQKVGFVGVSGAGKTTLCQLLLRAFDVTGGGIYIDGQNIAGVTQDSLHDAIAVIPQEPVLFHRTLGENIRYSRAHATEAEIHAAAAAAAATGFIETLPASYDTLVGERGIKLSGGQRQRIAIARAILKNAPVLVLDEATSALDSETEKAIQKALGTAMKGRTTMVIAHRLSTLNIMDRLVVIEEGKIVEDGSFDELIAKKGVFYRLWQLQAGGFLPH